MRSGPQLKKTIGQSLPILLSKISSEAWCDAILTAVAGHVVGNRPDRFEPRLVKRRPKTYKHLREPRRNYKP
jgi:putative transposase